MCGLRGVFCPALLNCGTNYWQEFFPNGYNLPFLQGTFSKRFYLFLNGRLCNCKISASVVVHGWRWSLPSVDPLSHFPLLLYYEISIRKFKVIIIFNYIFIILRVFKLNYGKNNKQAETMKLGILTTLS